MNLVLWQGVTSPQRATSQRYLGHFVEYYVDTDASTLSSWKVYANLSAYQFASGISAQDLNFYYFTGTHASPQYYDSDPYYYQRLRVNNTNGVLGNPVQFDAGTYASGATVTPYYFCGNSLGGTWYYSEYNARPVVPSAPAACATVSATRNSDTQATITWDTAPASAANILRVRRYADGTLSQTWTYDGASNFISTYVDTGIATGHAYTYTVEYGYYASTQLRDANYTLWATATASAAIYTSPVAPSAISGARIAANTVRLTLTNTASTSTGLEVQASTSASDWGGAITSTYAGAGVTSADFAGLAGIYYFRARNTRGALVSAWSPISAAVATLTAPAAPTLISPNAAIWDISTPAVVYRWQHNPLDGSAQTAAELQTSTDGGSTWTTYSETTAQSHTVTYSGADVGKVITWRVRTKGAASSWGPYSASRTFTIVQAPTVTITLTDGNGVDVTNGTLSDMPLNYALTVNDPSGTVAAASVSIGTYSEDATALSGSIDAAEFLPENGTTYTFTATVQSTSTLAAAGSVTVSTAFIMPQAGTLSVTDNEGVETLTAGYAAQQPGESAAVSLNIYREYAGSLVLVAAGLADGDTVTDLYAPLNVEFAYIVATFSAAGIATQTRFPQRISCNKWQVIYGGGKVAAAIWNPAGEIALKRPQRTMVQYIGRKYPVSYDGTALSDERTMTWVLLSEEERDAFIDLMESGGVGVYKSGDGAVFMAAFDVKFKPAYTTRTQYGTVSLTITRTESGAL